MFFVRFRGFCFGEMLKMGFFFVMFVGLGIRNMVFVVLVVGWCLGKMFSLRGYVVDVECFWILFRKVKFIFILLNCFCFCFISGRMGRSSFFRRIRERVSLFFFCYF